MYVYIFSLTKEREEEFFNCHVVMLLVLPPWVPLEKRDIEITISEWLEQGRLRYKRFLSGEKWSIPRNVPEEIKNDWIKSEFAGHVMLRLVASQNERLKSWLIEMEGDLFQNRLLEAPLGEILTIMKYFWGEDDVKLLEEFSTEDINQILTLNPQFQRVIRKRKIAFSPLEIIVAVKFFKIPYLLGKRQVLLYKGWGINFLKTFLITLKRAYEETLREKIAASAKVISNLDVGLRDHVELLKEELLNIIQPKISITSSVEIKEDVSLYPPCMYDLYMKILNRGHLPHNHRLQLGLFLKQVGMSVDDQMMFWYKNAVDNVNRSFDDFKKKVGYIIRHLYGLEGSKTDYQTPSCSTIKGSYYCPLAHLALEAIIEQVSTRFSVNKDDPLMVELRDLLINNKTSLACAKIFQIQFKRRTHPIQHPLQYVVRSSRIVKKTRVKGPSEEK